MIGRRPKVVMLENVTGYKKDEEFRVYAQIVEGMKLLGYDHKEAVLDAASTEAWPAREPLLALLAQAPELQLESFPLADQSLAQLHQLLLRRAQAQPWY